MKHRIALLAGLLCSCITVAAHAAQQINVGLNDVIATVERSFKAGSNGQAPVTDFTADFFQHTQLKKDQREMRSDGFASVRLATASSPLMYRFQYYRPYQQEIVSDGNSLWIYHPENREVFLSNVGIVYNRPGFNPDRDRAVNFLQGLGRISKDFQITQSSPCHAQHPAHPAGCQPRQRRLLRDRSKPSHKRTYAGSSAIPLTPVRDPDTNRPGTIRRRAGISRGIRPFPAPFIYRGGSGGEQHDNGVCQHKNQYPAFEYRLHIHCSARSRGKIIRT